MSRLDWTPSGLRRSAAPGYARRHSRSQASRVRLLQRRGFGLPRWNGSVEPGRRIG